MTRHETLTGRQHAPDSIEALRAQLAIELMLATIEVGR
jgi:hypothetical protein